MPSKTRFFNITLLRKNITRFWPLWAVYLAMWLLAMTATIAAQLFGPDSRTDPVQPLAIVKSIYDMAGVFGIGMACAFSCLCAMAVLSYLYTPRSAGFMHSLPIKRGGLFATTYASGYLFMLVPNAAVFAVTGIVTAAGGCPAFGALWTWFLLICGMELFFYSFAMLCGMMTGQVLMLPLLYGILNFLAEGMCLMFTALCETFMYGYSGDGNLNAWAVFSPAVKMAESLSTDVSWNEGYNNMLTCSLKGAGVVAAYAAVGAAIAVAVYIFGRVRKSETAGDAISFGWAKIAFKFGVGFCSAFTLGQLFYAIFVTSFAGSGASLPGMLVCALVAGAIGYYAAQMLMEKSFRVFAHGRICAAVLAAVVIAVCCIFASDVTGYEKYVPSASEIKEVEVSLGSWSWYDGTVTSGDNVLLVTEIHQSMIDQRAEQQAGVKGYTYSSDAWENSSGSMSLIYTLNNGKTLSRRYSIYLTRADEKDVSTITGMISELVDSKEFMVSSTFQNMELAGVNKSYIQYLDGEDNWQELNLTKSEWTTAYNAIEADVSDGNMPGAELFGGVDESGRYISDDESDDPYSNVSVAFDDGNRYVSVSVTSDMKNLVAALNGAGILGRIGK